jgi:gamma-glutamyltranspeptidase/glutathione hydrolase
MLWRRKSLASLLTIALAGPSAVGQQQIEARKYVVASGHPAATAAGLEVLRRGGNVVDAAITTSLALGVALPCGSGVGGKMVALYREAETKRIYCIDAVCTAPAGLDATRFSKLPESQRRFGYRAAGIPALPAGLWAMHERWGSEPWSELVKSAADLAENGVEVTEDMHCQFAPDSGQMRRDPEAARLFLEKGKALPTGCIMRNPDLAATLRRLADGGRRGFYEGETARRIAEAAQEHGSPLTMADLRTYQPQLCDPLSVDYRGHRIYTSPPPQAGGLTVLWALKALEKQSWNSAAPRDAEYIDRIGRIMVTLYPRVDRGVADFPDAYKSAVRMLSSRSVNRLISDAALIDPADPRRAGSRAETVEKTVDDLIDASTSHLVVADAAGNVISLTQSLSYHFGASVVVPGTGILLNNSLSNFSVVPKSVNFVSPGKRPRSTVAPIIVTHQDEPEFALGIPGGQRIPTTSIQLMVDALDFRLPLAQAFAEPRFHVRRPLKRREPANVVDLEAPVSAEVKQQLAHEGWQIVDQAADGRYFGGGNAVQYADDGRLVGVADVRRNNLAAGD